MRRIVLGISGVVAEAEDFDFANINIWLKLIGKNDEVAFATAQADFGWCREYTVSLYTSKLKKIKSFTVNAEDFVDDPGDESVFSEVEILDDMISSVNFEVAKIVDVTYDEAKEIEEKFYS